MKVTPENFKKFKKLYKDVVGISVTLADAQEHFDKKTDEYVLLPKLNPVGLSLILDYLDEKHQQKSNITVVDCSLGQDNLKDVLDSFSKMPNGSKTSLVIHDGAHWRTAYCERKDNKSHIAVIDSCGVVLLDNPVEEVVNANPSLKENTVLYRSVNKQQAAENNCGIFAIRTAQKLCKEQDFFGKLQKGNLILTKAEANSHFLKSRQFFGDKQDKKTLDATDNFFVLPPEYFALTQKKSYLKHYKAEFGSRTGISEFTHKTKAGKTVFIDDLFSKAEREQALTDKERTLYFTGAVTKKEDHNVNVVYFSNKYIEAAIFDAAKQNKKDFPDLHAKKRREILRSKANAHLSHTEAGKKKLAQGANTSTIDDILSKEDKLKTANVSVSLEEKEALLSQNEDHYQILLAEDKLRQLLDPPTQEQRAAPVGFAKQKSSTDAAAPQKSKAELDESNSNAPRAPKAG